MKSRYFFLCALVLLSNVYADQVFEEITKPDPKFLVHFSDQVDIDDARIRLYEGSTTVPVGFAVYQGDKESWTFSPETDLANNNYFLEVQYRGLGPTPQPGRYEYFFTINVPPVLIKLTNPPGGFGTTTPYNITFKTTKLIDGQEQIVGATCKWAFGKRTDTDLSKYINELKTGHGIGPGMHKLTYTKNSPEEWITVACEYEENVNYEYFLVGVLKDGPVLTASATPNPVVDEQKKETLLSITSNQAVQCRINGLVDYNAGYDLTNLSAYTKTDSVKIPFPGASFTRQDNHTYNITCANRAGLKTSIEYLVEVLLSKTLRLNVDTPSGCSPNTDQDLAFTTNLIVDWCKYTYKEETKDLDVSVLPIVGVLPKLSDGKQSIGIECSTRSAGVQEFTHNFEIDNTAPTLENLSLPGQSCSLNSISFEVDSSDEGCGIKGHNYTLLEGTKVLEKGFSTKSKITVKEKLEDGKKYSVTVVAIDQGGKVSKAKKGTFTAKDSSDTSCDEVKPRISFLVDKDGPNTNVSVGCSDGEGSGCKESYKYDLVKTLNPAEECEPSKNRDYDATLVISEPSLLCVEGEDKAGNVGKKRAVIRTNIASSCQNEQQDTGETDVDCGGNCAPCDSGASCVIASDCSSGACTLGSCAASTCGNGIKDGLETDVDCGGDCGLCAEGKVCQFSVDCVTGYCNRATRECENPSCSDGVKNGDEDDIDCGGDCGPCQESPNPFPNINTGGPEKTGPSLAGLILLIFGVLAVMGGGGWLYYAGMTPKTTTGGTVKPLLSTPSTPGRPKPVDKSRLAVIKEKLGKKPTKSTRNILESFKASETEEVTQPKPAKKSSGSTITPAKPKTTPKETPEEPKKLETKKVKKSTKKAVAKTPTPKKEKTDEQGYANLDEISEGKKSTKKGKKDVFDELEKL